MVLHAFVSGLPSVRALGAVAVFMRCWHDRDLGPDMWGKGVFGSDPKLEGPALAVDE